MTALLQALAGDACRRGSESKAFPVGEQSGDDERSNEIPLRRNR